MYARILAGDADYDGRFFTGVLTTGIYCLPSCKARKPKPENVRFFPTCEAARNAGLRPCRRCHPDDFARGADPVLESIETLVAELRSAPDRFPDVRAVVRRSGFGSTRVFELFRQHYHTAPAGLLLRARLDAVKRGLLSGDEPLVRLAGDAGFESLSVLHEHFRDHNGMTPAAYRGLRDAREFEIALPEDYPWMHFRRTLGRDPHSLTERVAGDTYTAVIAGGGAPFLMTLHIRAPSVRVEAAPGAAVRAHAAAVGLLGLDQEPDAFARLCRRLGLGRLVAGRAGLRLSQTPSVFDGLMWAIIGQQIHFKFACLLKRRLVELAGSRMAKDLYAPPSPEAVARLKPEELLALQFSRRKAEYLIGAARLAAEGAIDLAVLPAASATRVERALLGIRGLGPWSVNYLMMRSLGFPDCVPLGDTGVASGLKTLFRLEERPDIDATRRLMAVFSPYRSLATAHLWQINQPEPESHSPQ
jgi:AraC family transcriptional regulator of adaptative response / DNA-3-methyladenine glycosylase II